MTCVEVVVITGGTGSGKSTVAEMIRGLGYPVVDADLASRTVLEPGWDIIAPHPLRRIRDLWPQCFSTDGAFDRKALGRIVFANKEARETLEAIMLPCIEAECVTQIQKHVEAGHELVFLDSPLFFEMGEMKEYREIAMSIGLDFDISSILLVTAPESVRIERTMKRDGISEEVVRGRIAAQLPDTEKLKRAALNYECSIIIEGDQPLDTVLHQVTRSVTFIKAMP